MMKKIIMLILVGLIDKLIRDVFLVKGGGGILRDNECYVVFLSGFVIVYLCACNCRYISFTNLAQSQKRHER